MPRLAVSESFLLTLQRIINAFLRYAFGKTTIFFDIKSIMEQEFELIAKTFMGLEPVLAEELTGLGANNVQIGRRMVSFTGDKEMMYRANFQLHTAIRVLKTIKHFKARSADDVYNNVNDIQWDKYIAEGNTFAVDSVVFSEEFRNSHFVSYKVKDAIVDWFRERTGKRPNISVSDPDIRLHIHIAEDDATLCLDSSGESLHRRGYRQETMEAPLNEVLAAGMILMTGWRGECDLIDPMCGSGTIAIEAALIARNISPGVFRKGFAFEKWPDFDKELFEDIYNDDSEERDFEHHIYAYDIDMKAINTARLNVKAAGMTQDISLECQDFKNFSKPEGKSIMIMNPPYGERITTPDLLGTYRMIGERLKHEFGGNEAWILSYREECFDQIGLKPSIKIPVYNGSLECEFRKYMLFDGKMADFRSEGGIVKTEEEKREMAQKHRFKKNREFKERLDEREQNEAADIRSFKFHSLDPKRRDMFRQSTEERDMKRNFRRDDFKRDDFSRDSFRKGDSRQRGKGDFKRDGFRKGDFKRGGRDEYKGRGDFKSRDFKGGKKFGGNKFGRDRRFEDED